MPLYEYRCPEHDVFEIWDTMKDVKQIIKCEKCGTDCSMVFSAKVFKTETQANHLGKKRSDHDKILREEGWGSCFKDNESVDKCKYLEKKGVLYPNGSQVDSVK